MAVGQASIGQAGAGQLAPARQARFHIGLAYHWQALIAVVLGTFVVVLNQTIVNVALPRVIQVFQATVDQGQLVLTTYMLALAVFMPATGFLTDRLASAAR